MLKAKDYDHAVRLMEAIAQFPLTRGDVGTLIHWTESLPDTLLHAHPRLFLLYVPALFVAGRLDDVTSLLDTMEQYSARKTGGEGQYLQGVLLATRAYLARFSGDLASGASLAHQAIEHLPSEDVFVHSALSWLVGIGHTLDADIKAANRTFRRTIEQSRAGGNLLTALLAIHTSATTQMFQGRLRMAQETLNHGLRLAEAERQDAPAGTEQPQSLGVSMLYNRLGILRLEQNDLDDAARYLEKSLDLAEHWGNATVLANVYIDLARIKQAGGDMQGARAAFHAAERYTHTGRVRPMTIQRLETWQARLWIAEGNLKAAELWAARWQQQPALAGAGTPYIQVIAPSTLARLRIAQGAFDAAQTVLSPLRELTVDKAWTGALIKTLALLAVTRSHQQRRAEALELLRQALTLAEPEGFVRTFVELGTPMAELLAALKPHLAAANPLSKYVYTLLATFPQSPTPALGPPLRAGANVSKSKILDPLSKRELEVLELIDDGLSNREIAEQLFVAVSTIKTHTISIYRKLDVSRRTQALARAKALDLL
ncbi:MAG: tetratricopeptide repeat protein [Chloroflexi bacterium]|nr:tetratricopeptide repeat protein [Chloroflexota bacterium]